MSHGKIVVFGVIAVVIIFVVFGVWNRTQPGKYDAFAQCLDEAGAIFYGTFWCPYCQEQKALFGRSERHLPYRECSTPSGQGQVAECDEAGITSYPTWVFADGERLSGVRQFEELSERTGCELPV